MNTIIIKGQEVQYRSERGVVILSEADFISLADTESVSPVGNDMDAGRKFYTQVDTLVREGKALKDIKVTDINGVKTGTAGNYLGTLKAIVAKRESAVNPMYIMRRIRGYGCLTLLALL